MAVLLHNARVHRALRYIATIVWNEPFVVGTSNQVSHFMENHQHPCLAGSSRETADALDTQLRIEAATFVKWPISIQHSILENAVIQSSPRVGIVSITT